MKITNSQFTKIEKLKSEEFVLTCKNLLKADHPGLYTSKSEGLWSTFIQEKLDQAQSYGILFSGNQFVFVLTTATFPLIMTQEFPDWANDILTWPDRSEDDKIILLCKEIYKRNQTSPI